VSARAIGAGPLAAALGSATPPVLLDIRDPVEAERGHIPGATNLPRRRIEFRIGELVRDAATPIVVCGGDDARGELAAATLQSLGYADVSFLAGGIAAWRAAGERTARGNNVPSKTFGEHVLHERQVPSIDAETLLQWQREGRRIAILDVRTPGEHRQACIPGAISAPSFDIALQAADLAAETGAVVLHCAGRTRSIIGARTLLEMGVPRVVALENGTMGWLLAGHAVERGSTRQLAEPTPASVDEAERTALRIANAAGVLRIDVDALTALLAEPQRNFSVFDVRSLDEHDAGHIPGSTAVPGGQVVQRADDFIAVRGANIVLVDEREARAHLTGTWLRRMGFPNVSVLGGGVHAWRATGRALATGRSRSRPLGWAQACAAVTGLAVDAVAAWRESHPDARVLHVDTSASYRTGHLRGAQWVPRGWLEQRIECLAQARDRPLLVSCADGAQSVYAAATLRGMGYAQVRRIEGGTRAWAAAGHALDAAADMPPQDDELLAPYQRGEQAMRDYIDWEKLLVPAHSNEAPTDPSIDTPRLA
jgi:rhodanese-related sulfurtransferase